MSARFLVLVRAGDSSLHPGWLAPPAERNWDFAVSCFGGPPKGAEQAVFVHMQSGPKWPGLLATLNAHREIVDRYDYVWMPDDDLACDAATIDRLFRIAARYRLELAQPALTPDSYFSYVVTLQHRDFELRFTNFVEAMAPVLSREFLQRIRHTLEGTVSGWGLDIVWPRFSSLGRVAVIDAATVVHTRPVGGPNYKHSKAAGLDPLAEIGRFKALYGVEDMATDMITLGGVTGAGRLVAIGQRQDEIDAFLRVLGTATRGLKLSTVKRVHYFGGHLNFSLQRPAPYARHLIAEVLQERLAALGMPAADGARGA